MALVLDEPAEDSNRLVQAWATLVSDEILDDRTYLIMPKDS